MQHATFVVTGGHRDRPRTSRLTRYGDDAHAWSMERADLLKARRFADLGLNDPTDAVADLGRRACDRPESDAARVIRHPLEWDHAPDCRSRVNTAEEHRRRAARHLDRDPSLGACRRKALSEAFPRGRGDASIGTEPPSSTVPGVAPCSGDDAMTRPIARPEP